MNSYSHTSKISAEGFRNAVNIYIQKPHVVNKRLWGVKVIYNSLLHCQTDIEVFKNNKFLNESEFTDDKVLDYLTRELNLEQNEEKSNNEIYVTLLELLPKVYKDSHAYILICNYAKKPKVVFFDLTPKYYNQNLCPNYAYSFEIDCENILVKALCCPKLKSYQWLISTVVPQLIKWALDIMQKSTLQSLSLVSSDRYYCKYYELKHKYGIEMVKIWPEVTDPAKFVYEDIAIATYLLLLWEIERIGLQTNELQSFVDLGCGNGLLVFILTSEGHPGVGIDVRKRNIWDLYPKNIKLEERTVTPSDFSIFPKTDWIIGNHSDELTPWIPVMALRSSYYCRFFLLPCCAFNFDGSKYQRKNSSKSQYGEYLEYIESLSVECGFVTEIDKLKIPSTKRTCIVGRLRSYLPAHHKKQCNKIQTVIDPNGSVNSNENCWITDFKARDPIEKVRNCTQIDKTLIDTIVNKITQYLLNDCDFKDEWTSGNTAAIQELISIIPNEMLKKFKAECGGLQTLIKNNNHIFHVQKGQVKLRFPKTVAEVMKSRKTNKPFNIKRTPCWFYNNHPQGCPLPACDCSFQHENIVRNVPNQQ